MNIEPMEIFCTITGADQRISPQGSPNLEITFDCHLSNYPTRSFCDNPELFYLADAPKPIEKMLSLKPTKPKNNKQNRYYQSMSWNPRKYLDSKRILHLRRHHRTLPQPVRLWYSPQRRRSLHLCQNHPSPYPIQALSLKYLLLCRLGWR